MIALAFWEDRSGGRTVKYSPGDSIPDDHPRRDWLIKSGIAQDAKVEHKVEKKPRAARPAAKPVEQSEPKSRVKRPKPTDSVDVWRAFAKERGIDTKGLTKPQLIKATK